MAEEIIKNRLENILINLKENKFSLLDAIKFIEYGRIIENLPEDNPLRRKYYEIKGEYERKLLYPVIKMGSYGYYIIKYLDEKSFISISELENLIKNKGFLDIVPMKYSIRSTIRILASYNLCRIERGILGKFKGISITEEGRIAALLVDEFRRYRSNQEKIYI
ncbi:hypothetical protein BA065_02225 [Nanoarchaeota archaeon NZ13-N]|nr:MAG: hypothetical protein BA065_02225 [Nanoarchaeota archaeon NZ13-N]